MYDIKILHKGDEVICVNDRFLAVKRKNGVVDIFKVVFDQQGSFMIDPVRTATVGFGEGTISASMDDETTVYSF